MKGAAAACRCALPIACLLYAGHAVSAAKPALACPSVPPLLSSHCWVPLPGAGAPGFPVAAPADPAWAPQAHSASIARTLQGALKESSRRKPWEGAQAPGEPRKGRHRTTPFGTTSAIQGQAPEVAPVPAGVEIVVEARPQQATVGDPIRFEVRVSAPPGYRIEVSDPGRQIGDFDVIEFLPEVPEPRQGQAAEGARAGVTHRCAIIAAVYRTGEFEFPPLPVVLRDPGGAEIRTAGPPAKVRIESVLAENDRDLKDLKPQAEIAAPFPWLPYLVGAALLAALAALAYRLRRRRRAPPPAPPAAPQADPLELAEAELRALQERGLPEPAGVKPFYVTLADIAKKILEAGYGIQTAEKTTSEIVAGLRGSLPGRELERIENLLLACDYVKFARYIPSAQEHGAALAGAWEILAECRKARVRAVPQGAAAAAPNL